MELRSDALSSEPVYDRYEVMRRFEYDLDAFEELVQLFASCYHDDIGELQSAIEDGELESISRVSRRLKDAARSFSSEPVYDAVDELEQAIRGKSDRESTYYLSRLQENLEVLQAALDEAIGK